MATRPSYYTLYASTRRRDNRDEVYTDLLEKLAKDLDLGGVKSCLTIGPGTGEYEIQFIKRFMPNLRTLTAVEPDAESVAELNVRLETELPDVKSTIREVSGQNWNGLEEPVDVVLLFRVLFHFAASDLRALFRKLFARWMVPGGFVVVENAAEVASPANVARLHERLNPDRPLTSYEDIRPDIVDAGFSVMLEEDFHFQRDFRSPDEELLQFYQLLADNPTSLDEVRAAIAEQLFPDGKATQFYKLAVFKRPL